MIRTLLVAALFCVVCSSASYARVKHGHHYRAQPANSNLQENLAGCDAMRPCYGNGRLLYGPAESVQHASRHSRHVSRAERHTHRRVPEGLAKVMAEGAGRAINWHRPRAWCGWQMRKWLGVANPSGNLARWWAGFGRPAHGPAVGAIVVWRHHVGRITGKTSDGRWVVKSGNDGHAVRERPRSVAGAIAFRWPA
jgi:hypothetical protein